MDRPKDKEELIKAYEDFVNGYECFCTSDDYEYEMHKAVLALLKEQEKEIENLKEIIKNADNALESIKERINEILYEDFSGRE